MKKEPLFRKKRNNESFSHHNNRNHADYKHIRNTKKHKITEDGDFVVKCKEGMHNTSPNGYDYTPLYRFLQSKVGKKWNDVFSEAKSRLDKEEPIWHIVYLSKPDIEITRWGEGTYYHTLYIDENNILQYTNKNATLKPHAYSFGTMTLDGKVLKKDKPELI